MAARKSWWAKAIVSSPAFLFGPARHKPGYRRRLVVEPLEDRCVPTTITPTTFADGVLYVPGNELRAFKDRKELWSAKNVVAGYPTPVVYEGRVYGLTKDFATCFDAKPTTFFITNARAPFPRTLEQVIMGSRRMYNAEISAAICELKP